MLDVLDNICKQDGGAKKISLRGRAGYYRYLCLCNHPLITPYMKNGTHLTVSYGYIASVCSGEISWIYL